jgi:hypothetical protein
MLGGTAKTQNGVPTLINPTSGSLRAFLFRPRLVGGVEELAADLLFRRELEADELVAEF